MGRDDVVTVKLKQFVLLALVAALGAGAAIAYSATRDGGTDVRVAVRSVEDGRIEVAVVRDDGQVLRPANRYLSAAQADARDGRWLRSSAVTVAPTPSLASELPSRSNARAFTQAYVERAANFYSDAGRQAAIDYYNSDASVIGDWYIFIMEADGTFVAHGANPSRLGKKITDADVGIDLNGDEFGLAILDAPPVGVWVDYRHMNARTGTTGDKHTYVIRRGDLIFAGGFYEADQ